jgi:hypothetical protein
VSFAALQFVEIAEIKNCQQHAGVISQFASCDCFLRCLLGLWWMVGLNGTSHFAQTFGIAVILWQLHNGGLTQPKIASLVSFQIELGAAHHHHHHHHLGTGRLHRLSRQVMKLEVVPD